MKEIKNVLIISVVVFLAVFSAVLAERYISSLGLDAIRNSIESNLISKLNSEEVANANDEVATTEVQGVTTTTAPKSVTTQSKPVPKPSPKPSPKPTPKPVTACIITISGSKYNVTSLVNSHSGGNVFRCGTDMTAVFFSQHSSLSLIARYKI